MKNGNASRRRWVSLALRVGRLMLHQPARTADLVSQSYDAIAPGYDRAWTSHMRALSLRMLDVLAVPPGAECIDLTCGTGFVTSELAARAGTRTLGVDASAGMLSVAKDTYGDEKCDFVQSDVLEFLRSRPAASADVITCAWGLGYSQPVAVVRQIARVLRPSGQVGIIDNTLFSLAEVMWASLQTFAERPDTLAHAMKVRFLPHSLALATMMRLAGLGVSWRLDGGKTYHVPDGRAAIARLSETGAAAGFEFAAAPACRDAIFERFAQILDHKRRTDGVAITHRYLAAVGAKP